MGLDRGDLTPGAAEVVCLGGVLDSFATVAEEVLPRMTGLRLSESTVQRMTEGVGREVGRRSSQGEVFGPARDWAWHKDAEGETCAYVSIDATGVPQQGPHVLGDRRLRRISLAWTT